jgi:hypothetical protein
MKKNPPISCIDEYLVGGIARDPSENHGVRTSWDDEIPQLNGKIKDVPNHQPVQHRLILADINPTSG